MVSDQERERDLLELRERSVPYAGWREAGFWAAGVFEPWQAKLSGLGDALRPDDVVRFVGCPALDAERMLFLDSEPTLAQAPERVPLGELRVFGTLLMVAAQAEGTFADMAGRAARHGAPADLMFAAADEMSVEVEELWRLPVAEVVRQLMFRLIARSASVVELALASAPAAVPGRMVVFDEFHLLSRHSSGVFDFGRWRPSGPRDERRSALSREVLDGPIQRPSDFDVPSADEDGEAGDRVFFYLDGESAVPVRLPLPPSANLFTSASLGAGKSYEGPLPEGDGGEPAPERDVAGGEA